MSGSVRGRDGTPAERFWRKVQKTDGCWLWVASTTGSGYGQFAPDKRPLLAHRVSYEWAFGPIPTGLFVCHSCDNRLCVNPSHLWLGTATDNLRDMVSKGRNNPNTDYFASVTHCQRGHRYEKPVQGTGKRRCDVCADAYRKRAQERQNAKRRALKIAA